MKYQYQKKLEMLEKMTFKEPRNFDIFIASEYLKSKKDKTEFIPAQSFVVWF